MSAAPKWSPVSVEDYLAGELISPIKHEYVDGRVYAMAGARYGHNLIVGNVFATVRSQLRGRHCRAWNSDSKVRIQYGSRLRFYYPDVFIECTPNDMRDSFHAEPVVVFEVLSNRTRRADEGEKKDDYLSTPSLAVYVMIEQSTSRVVAYRRKQSGFTEEVYEGMEAVLPLQEVGIQLPLAEIYEDVNFSSLLPEDDGDVS